MSTFSSTANDSLQNLAVGTQLNTEKSAQNSQSPAELRAFQSKLDDVSKNAAIGSSKRTQTQEPHTSVTDQTKLADNNAYFNPTAHTLQSKLRDSTQPIYLPKSPQSDLPAQYQ